ncbi:MAG TPA: phosphodiester glycosidase family protein [Gemmatimonadales bacterium]|nr:phosphodiester glycosidase family protein [Gemmatimonadales bacterium]
MGRLAALAALLVAGFMVLRGTAGPHFRTLRPGLEFAIIRGEPFCRRGSSQIAVMRLDPERTRLHVQHYSRQPDARPMNIVEWQRNTRALAVFNAGQYYPDYSYMGMLVSGGEVISHRLHPDYKAALVAAPLRGGPRACVLDLTREPLDPGSPRWGEVAQSFMLFDQSGALRIRKTGQIANRTVVAQDRQGRLLVFTSEGGYTLHEFAQLLRSQPLHISHAMSMDGGYEAELCVQIGSFRYASFGRWERDHDSDAPGARVPLPAVVAVSGE